MSNLNNLSSVVAYITYKLAIPFLQKPTLRYCRKVVKRLIQPILRLILNKYETIEILRQSEKRESARQNLRKNPLWDF
jgi:hypothetical protein